VVALIDANASIEFNYLLGQRQDVIGQPRVARNMLGIAEAQIN
jgi:hypothetical protein